MATSVEFEGAGENAGIQVWRIENFRPEPVPKKEYGSFYSGDSYIILHSKKRQGSGSLTYGLYFWLGADSTHDEKGAAAYKTVELDEKLGGMAVQYREVQAHESEQFLSLFRKGIRYMKGGIDSGFKKVDRDKYELKLFHLKGRRNVRVTRVEITGESLNSGDVFILDAGKMIFQWNGKEASRKEKAKGLEVTIGIKDNERGGKARVVVLEEGDTGSKMNQFWKHLGGKVPVKSASEGGDDSEFEKQSIAQRKLYSDRVCDESGKLVITLEAEGVLNQKMLDSDDCFILDCGTEVFVWIGSGSTQQEKRESMRTATYFLSKYNKPDWTPITRVIERGETPLFKEKFSKWKDVVVKSLKRTRAPISLKPKEGARVEEVFQKKGGAVDTSTMMQQQNRESRIVDDGSGSLQIWRIENFARAPWPEEKYGQFFSGDSFIILYSYRVGSSDRHIIYFWQGKMSTADEKGASALLTVKTEEELTGGMATQVRVVDGKEPNHFLSLFKGKMIVHSGGTPSGFKNVKGVVSGEKSVSLYHIKGTDDIDTHTVEIEAKAENLNSGDCFLVVTEKDLWVWQGRGANESEKQVSLNTAGMLKGKRKVTTVQENQESESFWAVLGGKKQYAESSDLGISSREPRLFQCSNSSGVFSVEEIFNFAQEDLDQDDVFLLDTYSEVYVWVGKGSNKEEKTMGMKTAMDYVKKANDGRSSNMPVLVINQLYEPVFFTCHFQAWNSDYSKSGEDPYIAKLKSIVDEDVVEGSKGGISADVALSAYSTERTYALEELKKRPVPEHLDSKTLEMYLSDEDFAKYIGTDKESWKRVPQWKRVNIKKKLGLF